MKTVTSRNNPIVKEILKIKRKSSKGDLPFYYIEGEKICEVALKSKVKIKTLIISESFLEDKKKLPESGFEKIVLLKNEVFDYISVNKSSRGISAIVHSSVIPSDKFFDKDKYSDCDSCRIVVCEDIQDPGNFGSIIRTAEAFGFDSVVFTKGNVSPYNSKVLQATMGALFDIDLIYADSIDLFLNNLKQRGFFLYATHLAGENIDFHTDFGDKFAVIMGNEGSGVTKNTSDLCDRKIKIPMPGKAQSLNVSNAAAIICYLASLSCK